MAVHTRYLLKKVFFFFFGLSENSGRAIQSDTTKSFATILPRYLAKKDRYKTRSLHLAKEKLLKKLHQCGFGLCHNKDPAVIYCTASIKMVSDMLFNFEL